MDQMKFLLIRDLKLWVTQWFTPMVILLELVTYLVIFAFVLNNLITSLTIEGEQITYISFLFPGILVMNFFITSITSGLLIYMDRRLGMLELLLTAPISRQMIIASRLVSTTLKCLLMGGVLVIIACIFGVNIRVDACSSLYVVLCCTLFSLAMSALSIILTARLKSDHMFNAVTNAFNLPLIFASPLFYPHESMPLLLRKFSYVNPLTYGVNTIRPALVLEKMTYFGPDFLILVCMTIVLVFVAIISYNQSMEELYV